MATIRYLSWNIQTYGPRKYNNNRAERIDFIGTVIESIDANLVAIMELAPATANNILNDLCDWLNNRHLGQNWEYISVLEKPNNPRESYGFLWRTDENFTLDPNRVGWANYDDNRNMFDMPSTLTRSGGRRPAYASCRTQDTNQTFSVIVYHAPFSQQAILGDRRLAESEMLNRTPQNAANINGIWDVVGNSLLSGDFNIDYITDSVPSAYNPLRNRLEPLLTAAGGRTILTSLKYQISEPDGDYYSQDSLDYRSAAYDNIFYEDGVNAGGVVDVIELMMDEAEEDIDNWPELAAIARNFNFNQERGMHGLDMGSIGQDMSDNWLFYLSCISDHLPVYAEAVI